MSKVIVFSPAEELKPFFTTIEIDLGQEEVEFVWGGLNDIEAFKEELASDKNIIIVDYNSFEKNPQRLEELFSDISASLLVASNLREQADKAWNFKEICNTNRFIEGVIDTSLEANYSIPLILQLLKTKKEKLKEGQKLNRLIKMNLEELQKIKKLHKQFVPIRSEIIKPFTITSKFGAGVSPGGEFFDIIKNEGQFVLILTSSKSYVASSIILEHFEKLQDHKNLDLPIIESFLEDLTDEARNLELIDRDRPDLLELFILKLDLRDLSFEGYQFGNTLKVSSFSSTLKGNDFPLNENFFERAHFSGKMDRGEKMMITSSGVTKNLPEGVGGDSVANYIAKEMGRTAREMLDEIFFQLKRKIEGDFLKHDASLVLIEVDPNAIIQI